jgi:hypothetical protein
VGCLVGKSPFENVVRVVVLCLATMWVVLRFVLPLDGGAWFGGAGVCPAHGGGGEVEVEVEVEVQVVLDNPEALSP